MTKPVRYIFINRGLGMTPGKIAAQAAHAEMLALHDLFNTVPNKQPEGLWMTTQESLYDEWYDSGHYTKLTMLAEDSEHLRNIKDYIEARGYRTYLVIDEGRTEISPHSPTALAVELVDKDEERVQQHFGDFRTYKEKKPPKKKKRFGRS
jgi:peptidyl-tRNA hydrolase